MGPDQGLTRLFYDGNCSLCHRVVRFAARHGRSGEIHFAPLGGETFERLIPPALRTGIPDSLVALTPEGELLFRSGAVIHLLHRMGSAWHLMGIMLAWIPVRSRDWAYELVARRRPTGQACPRDQAPDDQRFEP